MCFNASDTVSQHTAYVVLPPNHGHMPSVNILGELIVGIFNVHEYGEDAGCKFVLFGDAKDGYTYSIQIVVKVCASHWQSLLAEIEGYCIRGFGDIRIIDLG